MEQNLKVNIKKHSNYICFYLVGQLDAHSAPNLESEISSVIDNSKQILVFNLSNLEYISSAGLGVFMSFVQQLRENDGDIMFTELNDRVKNVMHLLGFNHIFKIFETESDAVNQLAV
jgi:anti-sigma B factor antagonist